MGVTLPSDSLATTADLDAETAARSTGDDTLARAIGNLPASSPPYDDTAVKASIADLAAEVAAIPPPSSGSSGSYGRVSLDSFAKGSDDANLTAAMAYAAAQTHPPAIALTNRDYAFALPRNLYTGFRLIGPNPGIQNAELGNGPSQACRVNVTTAGTWLNVGTSDVFDVSVSRMAFVGGSKTVFLGTSGGVFHCSHLGDLSFAGFLGVLGSTASKLLMTASLINGWFQVQGAYAGAIHIGGSDNRLFTDGCLIDNSRTGCPSDYHVWGDGLDNSLLGPLYVTARGNWGALRVSGSPYNAGGPPNNLGMVWCQGATLEGMPTGGAGQHCNGALVKVEGGNLKLRDSYVGRGMFNPTANGHSPVDAGAIHVTGGQALLSGITFDRSPGIAESVPFVYNNGGMVRVRDTTIATKGGTWTGLPVVKNVSGTASVDESVTPVKTGGTLRQSSSVAL